MSIEHIHIGRDAQGNAFGDNNKVRNRNSFNSGVHGDELADLFATLVRQIDPIRREMKGKDFEQLESHRAAFAAEAEKPKPNRSVLAVTGKGLIEAAKTVGELAAPVISTVGVILKFFNTPLP
jgi:hypothetical protein